MLADTFLLSMIGEPRVAWYGRRWTRRFAVALVIDDRRLPRDAGWVGAPSSFGEPD
jgi:hypothetical protein